MNMISTEFPIEAEASSTQAAMVSKLVSVWEKKNSKAARAGGVSLMALSLAACGGEDDTPFTQADVTAAAAAATIQANAAATVAADEAAAAAIVSQALAVEAAEIVAAALDTTPFSAADVATAEAAALETGVVIGTAAGVASVDITSDNAAAVSLALRNEAIKAGVANTFDGQTDAALIAAIKTVDNAGLADAAVSALNLTGITTIASLNTAYTAAVAPSATTAYTLTAGTDALVHSTSANATFTGVLQANGLAGTTIAPGDVVTGGTGTGDKLTVSVAGDVGSADYTLAAVQTIGVENFFLSNFDTDGINDNIVDASLFNASMSTVGLASSSATGDTAFTGLKSLVGAEMRNGSADLTLTYNASVVSGAADTQTLTVSNISAGSFAAAGVETVAITTELAASTLTALTAAAATTVTIAGDQALTISGATTIKTIDASANTGGVTLLLGAASHTVTGTAVADSVDAGVNLTNADTLVGGAGSDTLTLSVGNATINKGTAAAKGELYTVSGFEVADIASTHDSATLNLTGTDITSVSAAANVKTVTFTGNANSQAATAVLFTLNGQSLSSTVVLTGNAAADVSSTNAAVTATINGLAGFTATSGATGAITVTATGGESVELLVTDQTGAIAAESDYKDVTVSNVGTQAINVYSADEVTVSLADASGAADTLNVNLATMASDTTFAKAVGDITANNIETINLDATGMGNGKATTVAALKGNAITKLNITGDSDVAITSFATTALMATVDGSTSSGDITLAAAPSALNQTISTGSGNDTITMGSLLTELDVLDAGGNNIPLNGTLVGSDKVTASGNHGTITDVSSLQIANAENIEIAIGALASTFIDAAGITGTSEIAFSNDNAGGTVTLTNLGANHTVGVGIGAVEFGRTTTSTLNMTMADSTGAADAISLNYSDTLNATNLQTLVVGATIETLNISASKTAQTSTITNTNMAAKNIVITDGLAGAVVALGTLNAATTNVDADAQLGSVTLTTAAAGAVTMTANGAATNASSITTGAGADTITIVGLSGTLAHTVNGNGGSDTLNITLSGLASDFTNVSAVETINITVGADTDVDFDDTTKDNGLNLATTVNILGGDSLSSFKVATALLTDDAAGTTMTLDASTFAGAIDIQVDSDAFDAELTIKGGALATDKVNTIIAGIDNKVASMTGVETLKITSTNSDTAAKADLTNVTGLTTLEAIFDTGGAADQISVAGITAGTKIKTTMTETGDNLVLALTDSSGTSDSLTVQLTDGGINLDVLDFDAVGIENVAFTNIDTTHSTTVNLAGLTATGVAGTSTVTFAGAGATVLNGVNASTDTINASLATGGLTLLAAERTSDAKTITGGQGDDNLTMEAQSDVMTGGLNAASAAGDTLLIDFNGILGGVGVNLGAADQVTSLDSVSNVAVQSGFESVNAAGYLNFGASIVGSTGANTITGTGSTDSINAGGGIDTVISTVGNDIVTLGTGADVVQINTVGAFNDGHKMIVKDFTTGTDKVDLNVTLVSDDGTTVAAGAAGAYLVHTGGAAADTLFQVGGAGDGKDVIFELSNANEVFNGNFVTMTATQIAAAFILEIDATTNFTTASTGEIAVIFYDNQASANAALMYIDQDGTEGTQVVGEVTTMAVFEGVGTDALVAADFI